MTPQTRRYCKQFGDENKAGRGNPSSREVRSLGKRADTKKLKQGSGLSRHGRARRAGFDGVGVPGLDHYPVCRG